MADQLGRSALGDHHFGGFREGIVVPGGHAGAVGSRAANHQQVANPRFRQGTRQQPFRVARRRREHITALTAVSHHQVFRPAAFPGRRRNQLDGMLRTIQGRPQKLGHAGVHLQELVSLAAGFHDIDDLCD
jgi:hypothetical protein